MCVSPDYFIWGNAILICGRSSPNRRHASQAGMLSGLTREHSGLTRRHFGLTRERSGLPRGHSGLTRERSGLTRR
ncbi:MAG: hypothetical protein JXB30_10210, partial [Anaerolineae bacterium]|nr:hypothetical protein [Anaerolineae bacterium]